MQKIDPTTVAAESSASSKEELSVEEVAQTQQHLMADGGVPRDNAIPAVRVGTVAEQAAVPTALGVATQAPISPPQPPAAPGLVLQPIPAVPLQPLVPVAAPLVKRHVSGRYRSTGQVWQVELRCDVDGRHPLSRVSADYYSVAGATVHYFGSMRVDAPTISVTDTVVTITGVGSYTWSAQSPRVRVTIPRVATPQPLAPATLQHLSLSNVPGATYVCAFAVSSFRTVQLEEDRQDTVGRTFFSYNTGELPSGGPARVLTVPVAYAEAGVDMQSAGLPDVVNTAEAGASWSDAELHAAMERHFSLWRDLPQWKVWLFHAQLHDLGPGLLGIMFDQRGRQRQGAAVFYEGIAGNTPDRLRLQLYTCVHELGHCFNLFHSWQKSFMTPPGVDRPGALSWMNYPWRYAGGPGAFWSAFGFQFDELELIHLRHAFRDNIIMGGRDFGRGAALEALEGWRDPILDNSGLKLELQAPSGFPFGAPISVEIRLSSIDARGKRVYSSLKPSSGAVEIAVRNPNNAYRLYRPLIQRCQVDETIMLGTDQPDVLEGAFIGYGMDGFYFDQPGFYEIRACYYAPDESVVLSNVQRIRVRQPLSSVDEEVANLFFDDEVGMLCSLVGSDYEGLRRGNDVLAQVREQYPAHPLATYARLIQGVNHAREFKHFGPDNRVRVRGPEPDEARQLLEPIVDIAAMPTATAEMQAGTPEYVSVAARSLVEKAAERQLAPDLRCFMQARRKEIATEVAAIIS